MSDTYAVVNKPKQPHPPAPGPAHSAVATPRSGSASRTHHYDNEAAATPLYSTVRPRAKPGNLQHSATPIYDTATPANHRLGEGPPSLGDNREYHLLPAEHLSAADDEYEDFSSSVTTVSSVCSPGGIGFNCRIQKPRGPRDPPAEWR